MTLVWCEWQQGEERSTASAERRRGLRVRQSRPVKIYDSAAARYVGGQTADVSSTGLRLELPAWTPLAPGKTLSVHVGMSDQGSSLANRRRMIPARVVWVRRDATDSSSRMHAGIEFIASTAAHQDAA
ncbi:MAG: PilZ domain-containing protein [Phycisphaerales bacterium]|nr:PilZ domain-containing protein [Phycisphaerales bacterium]